MSDDMKRLLIVFGGAAVLFYLLKGTNFVGNPKDEKRTQLSKPTMSPEDAKKNPKAKNAFTALTAYINAYNANEPQKALDELNKELEKELKVRVYKRSTDGKFVVSDLTDKIILVNN